MRKKQTRLPKASKEARIESLSHDGRGIARLEGKTTFIDGALANELVQFEYIRQKKDFDEGVLTHLFESSIHRVEPRCPHYGGCGGCSLQHLHVEQQLVEKEAHVLDLLRRTGHVEPERVLEPIKGLGWNYRYKARLSVRYVDKKQTILVGFREKNNPRYLMEIDQCSVLHPQLDASMMRLRQLIDGFSCPKSIAQIEVAAGDEDVALIFRHLSPLTLQDETLLKGFADETGMRIFLQAAGPDSVHLFYPQQKGDFLTYQLPDYGVTFQFYPTDFTQINLLVNRLMVKRALTLLALNEEDVLLDLFCGLGNFSLPAATQCKAVIGIEGSTQMVVRASMNATLNGIHNATFLAANLEEALDVAAFPVQQVNKLLLDPPRAGAFTVVKQIKKINPKRIVYVSCHPATLARDADVLVNHHGYRLSAVGVIDMFTHTAHVESIALFEQD